jgi:hypothetical protein
MPSSPAAPSLPDSLAAANRALWLATLGLMTAYMQTQAPAHRYLLAGRIARNFQTLSRQHCFDAGCRARFLRLERRWQAHAARLAPQPAPVAGGLLRFLRFLS